MLLHGTGDNALDWWWVMPALARTHRVYAPDLPGSGGSAKPVADYSPAFFQRFVADFLDALGVERAAVIGNSLGGLVALRLALSEPARVTALVLVDAAGLGRAVSPALRSLALPGYGKLAVAWSKTPPGAVQRALGRAVLLFAHPRRVLLRWLEEQYRLGRTPGFLDAQLAAVRAQVGLSGQREVFLDRLPHLSPISVTQVLPGTINTPLFDKARTKLGVKPVGLPAIYEPEIVANIIMFAAENPARDLVAGGATQAMILNQRLSPRLVDAILATRVGFEPQKTDEPKPEDAPDNLFGPMEGHDTAKNGFRALPRSLYNWLQTHPTTKRVAAGTALGALALLRGRRGPDKVGTSVRERGGDRG